MIERVKDDDRNFKAIATTLRGVHTASSNDWSAVPWYDGEFYRATRCPELDILDRVGGGDSFASGLVYGFLAGLEPQECVEYGAAHGALAMTTAGDTSTATLPEEQRLVRSRARSCFTRNTRTTSDQRSRWSRTVHMFDALDYIAERAPQGWRAEHDQIVGSDQTFLGFSPLSDSDEVDSTARKSAWARLLARVFCELNRTPPMGVVAADGPSDHLIAAGAYSPVLCDPLLRVPLNPDVPPRSLLLSVIALALRECGYHAIHARDISLNAVPDELVFAEAERNERVIVAADTDLGALLALRKSAIP